jgi:hypothetical protein
LSLDVTDSLGIAAFTRLPISNAGSDFSIIADFGSNYSSPAIFCDLNTGDGTFNVISPQSLGDGRIQQTLTPGSTMRCSWFVHLIAATPGASEQVVDPGVILVAKLCNADADLTQDDLLAACATDGAGIPFSVDVAGEPYIGSTSTSAEGVIDLPLPVGGVTFTITPQSPPGYGNPAYRCAITWPDGSAEESDILTLTRETPSHDLTWPSESEVICTYYFPVITSDDVGQRLVPDMESVDPGLYFFLRQCPDPTAPDVNGGEPCVKLGENPQYTMTIDGQPWFGGNFSGENGVSIQQANTTDQPVEYITGESVITIAPMPELGDPTYRCDIRRANGEEEIDGGMLDRNHVVLTQTWNLDDRIVCTIYYHPEGEPLDAAAIPESASLAAGIGVYARACPPGVDMNAPTANLCQQSVGELRLTVLHNGEQVVRLPMTGDYFVATGQAETPVTGTLQFTLTPLLSSTDPAYSCSHLHADGTVDVSSARLPATAVTWSLEWQPSDKAVCIVYYQVAEQTDRNDDDDKADNQQGLIAPGDGEITTPSNTLTIQYWTCPEGVDPADAQANLLLSCAMDQAARTVTVTTDAGAQGTSVTGSAAWPFTGSQVSVTQPGGTAASSAWCSSSWKDNGEDGGEFPDAVLLDGGVLTLTVSHPATTVYCDWFLFGAAVNEAPSQVPVLANPPTHTTFYRRWSG